MVILDNVSKVYYGKNNQTLAIDGISIYVEKGGFTSIVGSSGSGKSTLLNILGCLDKATQGNYFLDNEDIEKADGKRLSQIRNEKIGFVFQNFNLIKTMSALKNVELPLVICGMDRKTREAKAKAALELVGLSDRIYHRPYELSGGQQQRVAIARAVVTNPPLILADEPTGNLDSQSGQEIMRLLFKLKSLGSTVIMITHDEEKARKTDKIIRIKDGKIER